MKPALVLDTNILGLACPEIKGFSPVAVNLIWAMFNTCNSIVIDEDGKIMNCEYKKFMKSSLTLTKWMKLMREANKIKTCNGLGNSIKTLDKMDGIFACVAINSEDKILITENGRDFNSEVKRKLKNKNVDVLNLQQGYTLVCAPKTTPIIRKKKKGR